MSASAQPSVSMPVPAELAANASPVVMTAIEAPGGRPGDPSIQSTHEDARATITRLMEAHGDAVYSLCLRVLRNRPLAEDALQQVFVEAHRDLGRFKRQVSDRTWLLSIAVHHCQDVLNAARRWQTRIASNDDAVAVYDDPAQNPGQPLERQQLLVALESCLGMLSSEARIAVLLRFHVELSYEEVAVQLDARSDTLQSRVRRAMPALRHCLELRGFRLG